MSASSGIPPDDNLLTRFAAAPAAHIRFLKVSIADNRLVHDLSIPARAAATDDLLLLQDPLVLHDNTPAYILARLDDPPSLWTAISYVPDNAKIRDKMLYASTRNSLMKALGSATFVDSIFATSRSDLTVEAFAAHKRHSAAPKPLSSHEQELANIRAAESSSLTYQGTRGRTSHVDGAAGYRWSEDAEAALASLSRGEGCAIVILQIDTASEALSLNSFKDIAIQNLPQVLPSSDPCYAFLAWPHSFAAPPRREIVYIYSCPATSPVKNRMIYSCGFLSTFRAGESIILASSPMASVAPRRIETTDPKELDEAALRAGLGLDDERVDVGNTKVVEAKVFARPKRPARKL
ncbi:hypothetical protein APHAL10511_001270 [Amanita phalloides]|nr:hypothetical protein APHAL10511_001270 [Amanita phalloides]